MAQVIEVIQQFAQDVKEGLSAPKKYLSSKYFYDATGDELFRKIMHLPEYYLTRAEYNILETQSGDIVKALGDEPVQLIELGAGDGLKTKLLIRELLKQGKEFTYFPIDISANTLNVISENMQEEFGDEVTVTPLEGDYFDALGSANLGEGKKLILFLGSTIGNFRESDVHSFLLKLSRYMDKGDRMLIGFDLKKDPNVILSAYNDKEGITRAFNMNLLKRMNTELDADFDLAQFMHWPMYDPIEGAARSFIISRKKQDVHIGALEETFHFKPYEAIYVEISRKFGEDDIERYATTHEMKIVERYYDDKHYFTDVLMERV